MEVILLENILNLGNIGDKVSVKNGYGRNFLLKQGKALRFNKDNQDFVNKKKDELNKKNNEIKNKFKEIAKLVNNKTLLFNKESKENVNYVHRGLAQRSFTRAWTIADDTEVKEVKFVDGLLSVTLARIIPETHKKKYLYGCECDPCDC